MLSHDSAQVSSRPEVIVAVKVDHVPATPEIPTHLPSLSIGATFDCTKNHNITSTNMATDAALLECPMCDFTVLPSDEYVLRLHFEQLHTTDSPFKTEDDHQPQPPSLSRSSSNRKHGRDTPSFDDEEGTVVCPDPDCGEVIPLTDFNEHLDYHAAETLSFDETTGKYHSHHSSTTMQTLAPDNHSHTSLSKDSYQENDFTTDLPEAPRRHDGHRRKTKKHRERRNTSSSDKTTLSRSILSFNPFTKNDKSVKPPNNSGRLGVSATRTCAASAANKTRNPSLVHMPGRTGCPGGFTINSKPVPKSPSATALVEMVVSLNWNRSRTRLQASYRFLPSCPLSTVLCKRLTTVTHPPYTLVRPQRKVVSVAIETSRCCFPTYKARKLKVMRSFLAGRPVSSSYKT
jgi:hypothetical protein